MEPVRVVYMTQTGDALKAHSAIGARGWRLIPDMPADSPPNAVGHYGRGGDRAVLCRDQGVLVLIEYGA